MNDDSFDDAFRAEIQGWKDTFTPPPMPVVGATSRRWARPALVAAGLVTVAAVAAVLIQQNRPQDTAVQHPTQISAVVTSAQTTALASPAAATVRQLPESYQRDGRSYTLLRQLEWAGAVQTSADGRQIEVILPGFNGISGCDFSTAFAFVTSASSDAITVQVGEYREEIEDLTPDEVSCIDPAMRPGPWVTPVDLGEPLNGRTLADYWGGKHTVLTQESFPEPAYLPDGAADGQMHWNEPGFPTQSMPTGTTFAVPLLWRYYTLADNWLQIEVRTQPVNAPRETKDPGTNRVGEHPATISIGTESDYGPLKCLRWVNDADLALSVCSAGFPLENDELFKVADGLAEFSLPAALRPPS